MRSSPSPQPARRWARAERLDADRMAEALHERTGVRLTVEGPCPGGQVGAAYVRWPDGRRSVLKWRPRARVADLVDGPIAVSEALRAAGCPVPATELVEQVDHAVVTVQELLPGSTLDRLDAHGLEQALALNRAFAGRLADRPDIPAIALYLREDGPGFCLHEPLRRHGARAAALERWVTAVGAAHPPAMEGEDAVHLDYHPGNMLAVDGTLTGVIDWDGAGRGHHGFDLVTLRFGVHVEGTGPGVEDRLDEVLDALPETVLRPAWAHMSLRMVDWSIRHHTPADVEHWLDLAARRTD
ncbi:Phosphotransferase enzyme family protein [Streptomyces zhaozhouensis]|uniref:Phosphotransferase enzyme family protein n=1 Tax=Streptomyces zhaozhouensis TaxID=1300267 RepID=A0A286DUA6_9ACTN|nr:aminoglycoside phosphotransferase family protein [Streptomyces zhaozhouensis]SOD62238.1 Phosphotransferase enzyme family protein [Streptomyces zhaozhouensis]